ncbi:MAG TPA: hypothetical protein VMR17_16575, partial [Xanthobacteraceae bacterium]|nr:hypothetical protein [Xanthobacteraceae bacterium]
MRRIWPLLLGIAGLTIWPQLSFAQIPTNPPNVVDLPCTNKPADPEALKGTADVTKALLSFGLPCQEKVSTADPPNVRRTALQNLQHGFDFYSWLTFIALNSPRDGSSIADAKPDTPTKWEGLWEDKLPFIQLADVMRTDVKDPGKQPRAIPPNCQAQYKPGMMVINMIEETYNQPFKTGPLIDQRDNYALFDILMNKDMFDYIVQHHLYSKTQQESAENSTLKIDFAAGSNAADKPRLGAMMIKVAWRILTAADDKSKYHTVDALISMPTAPDQTSDPPCLHKTLGLVGFHIVHKTVSRLQWIWTSFEHVDNVPDQEDIDNHDLKKFYNFYDPSCSSEKCPVNETPSRPWFPDRALELQFRNSFNSQIVRTTPIFADAQAMNRQFQSLLGNTVWQNYKLISTQWPSDFTCAGQTDPKVPPANSPTAPNTDEKKQPDMTCAPAPTFLANSTLETFSQGNTPLASSSCMACHGNAVSHQQQQAGSVFP